jgi:hypothetical protein
MNVIGILRFILTPYIRWSVRRRSKRDNRFTLSEIEQFHRHIHHRKP